MSPRTSSRRRTKTAMLMAAALAAPVLVAVPAQAAPCRQVDRLNGNCNLNTRLPGISGGGGGGGAGSGGSSGPVAPPPPEGLTADEAVGVVPVAGGPAPQPAAPATADLVAAVMASTEYPVPTVHTAPEGKTFVRVRTSLWVDGFDDVQTEPITDGAQTVQLVATPKSVTWNLGEKEIVCHDAGSKDGKTCNYTYQRSSASQPGGSYKITATITWDVRWTCEGDECDADGGSLGANPVSSAPTPLVIGEIQTSTGQ